MQIPPFVFDYGEWYPLPMTYHTPCRSIHLAMPPVSFHPPCHAPFPSHTVLCRPTLVHRHEKPIFNLPVQTSRSLRDLSALRCMDLTHGVRHIWSMPYTIVKSAIVNHFLPVFHATIPVTTTFQPKQSHNPTQHSSLTPRNSKTRQDARSAAQENRMFRPHSQVPPSSGSHSDSNQLATRHATIKGNSRPACGHMHNAGYN